MVAVGCWYALKKSWLEGQLGGPWHQNLVAVSSSRTSLGKLTTSSMVKPPITCGHKVLEEGCWVAKRGWTMASLVSLEYRLTPWLDILGWLMIVYVHVFFDSMDTEDSQAWRSLETVETSSQVARLADAWWRTGESGPHRDSSAVVFGSLPMILMLDHVGTFKVVLKTPSSSGLSGDCPPSHGGSQLMWDCFSVVVWCCWSSRCHLTSLLSCCLASEWSVLLLLSQSVLRTHGPATNSLVLHKQTAALSSKGDPAVTTTCWWPWCTEN